MKKSTVIRALIFCIVLFSSIPLFAQQSIQTASGNLRVFTLSNGFQIFVKEDFTTALVRTELVVKAGFSSQTPSTAGFFPLYANLFLSSASAENSTLIDTLPVTASCNQNSTSFTATSAPETVPQLFSLLSECIEHPQFSDASLSRKYSDMKKQVLDYQKSTTGFINSAIDSRIFASSPWKHDSGIYPALFAKYKLSEVRTFLTKIGRQYYTPDNSALFVSGNISADDVLYLAKRTFLEWNGYSLPFDSTTTQNRATSVQNTSTAAQNTATSAQGKSPSTNQKKRYVLTDASFPKDFSQIVVQYTNLSLSEADILAASFISSASPYKAAVLAEPALAVRSKDYLTAASSPFESTTDSSGKHGRLILQAILEKPYSFAEKITTVPEAIPQNTDQQSTAPQSADDNDKLPSPAEQASLFVSTVTNAAKLSRINFIAAQNTVTSKYNVQTGASSENMQLLSDYWALDNPVYDRKSGTDFYNRFLNNAYAVQNVSETETAAAVANEAPYIFLIVNTSEYEKQKDSFDAEGYEQVTKATASWYSDELFRKNAFAAEQTDTDEADDSTYTISSASQHAENFYTVNVPLFSSYELSNKIPLILKLNPNSQTAFISIAISGGELSSPANERFLRTILINAFAQNIQKEIASLKLQNLFIGDTKLQAWTDETASYITIECVRDDVRSSLRATTNAILFGDIAPMAADKLVSEQKTQWLTKSASLEYQMNCTALATFFSGTPYEKLYDANSAILKNTSINSISLAYTQLLDASLYTIVVSGDINVAQVKQNAEETFGVLKQQTERTSFTAHEPSVAKTTRKVQLRHTYTTDISAEDAGERPEILVPTTDFYDPVQYWLQSPSEVNERTLFNALLYELQLYVQKECGSSIKCTVKPATPVVHAACVQGDKVLHTNSFLASYKKAVHNLIADLAKDDGTLTGKIKSQWMMRTLSKTNDNEGTAYLMQQGLLDGNALTYLEEYKIISNADAESFSKIATNFITEDPVYKLYSVDSKK